MNKTKPILFSTPMVIAILDGRKTQTRRVIKKIPNHMHCGKNIMDWDLSEVGELKEGVLEFTVQCDVDDFYTDYAVASYRPGDILWVRETWLKADDGYYYKADIEVPSESEDLRKAYGYKWKPSIHMPREAARIFLKVKEVSVERLIDISDSDVVNEGFQTKNDFFALWDKLNCHRGFGVANNPFVWKIEFERVIRQNGGQD